MIRINSFGGGVQSVAALVLQAQGRINYDYFIFSNVGEDSENPATISYFRDHVIPFARQNNIAIEETRKLLRGKPISLYEQLMREDKSIKIPMRLNSGAFGLRACTYGFKVLVVARWVRLRGHREAVIGLNISTDEIHRARFPVWEKIAGIQQIKEYPLIDLGISRNDCIRIIAEAGCLFRRSHPVFFVHFTVEMIG